METTEIIDELINEEALVETTEDAVKAAVNEDVEASAITQPSSTTIVSNPKYIIESIIIEALSEMNRHLQSLAEDDISDLEVMNTKVKQFHAILSIWYFELEEVLIHLNNTKNSMLIKKHEAVKKVLPYIIGRITFLQNLIVGEEKETSGAVIAATKEAVHLISVLHILMHENTRAVQRRAIVKEFIRESDNASAFA